MTLRRNRPIALARILLTLWWCSVAPIGMADDLARGMQALDMGRTAQAIELWRPLAEAGNVDAQFGLGVIYNDAMGVPQDYAKANHWFLRAAEQGYAPAQYNLGNAYKNGAGMDSDPAMAVHWWRKAAEQGFMLAQFNLGSALLEGIGAPRDRAAGLEWYRRAAASGHPQAQHYLETQAGAQTDAAPKATTDTDADHREASQPADCTAWLDQDSNTHTVQLMASQAEADVRAYIARHTLRETAICHYKVKGKFWNALLYGRYDSANSARAALALLPAQVRAGGGYVRRIGEIHTAMNKP